MNEAMSARATLDVALKLLNSVGLPNLKALTEVAMVGDGSELTPAEVARQFGVSPATVRRWGAKGWLNPSRRLPGSTYRRYTRADVAEFRKRYEAGEFDAPPIEVAANRKRPAKTATPAPSEPPSVEHDPSPPSDGGPGAFRSQHPAVPPPSAGPDRH